jgi:hypothetical protein
MAYPAKYQTQEERAAGKRAYLARYYEENKERIVAHKRAYRESDPRKVLLTSAKTRAKSRGLKFDIELADIFIPGVCPVLGIPLVAGAGKQHAGSPSIDRIDPTRGYVKGNIQVISFKANTMKQDATPAQLLAFARWVIRGDVA